MAGRDLERFVEGSKSNMDRLGDGLRCRQRSLAMAAERQRTRACELIDGIASTLHHHFQGLNQHSHNSGSFSSARSSSAGPLVKANSRRNRNLRGNGIRFVSTASAAESAPGKTSAAATSTPSPSSESSSEAAKDCPQQPSLLQFLAHPIALLHFVPKGAALFGAGAIAGATAKTVTAPLDRWKLLLQVKAVQDPTAVQAMGKVNLLESFLTIGREEGILGYWKGNLPQVLRIIPYSAVQLFAYETYKNAFLGKQKELSVPARLAAGACAGMTSTFITYPLDVLRLRLAVEPGSKQMTVVALRILREEGALAFYKGLGPSLLSIAPYIALNFCAFDLVKKSIPEKYRKTPQASLFTALCATSFATVMCYPLDTVRRQMQMKNSPFRSVLDAFPGIVKRDGVLGLYRGFIANAIKNLPNSSIRLTTYDTVKQLIFASHFEFNKLVHERRDLEAAKQSHTAVQAVS